MIAVLQAAAGQPGMFSAVAILISALVGGGGLAALIQWLSNRGKNTAEEAEIWTRSSVTRLKTMHEEMTALEVRMRSLTEELEQERRRRIAKDVDLQYAMRMLRQHGIEFSPPSERSL